jgi:hypothetical protein
MPDHDVAIDPDAEPEQSAVASRASGRPPEEEGSEDPELQALVILEESEERTFEAGEASAETES